MNPRVKLSDILLRLRCYFDRANEIDVEFGGLTFFDVKNIESNKDNKVVAIQFEFNEVNLKNNDDLIIHRKLLK